MVKASGAGLLRDASGHLVESRMSSLSRDQTASRRKLIDEGLHNLLADLLKDLAVSLHSLLDLLKISFLRKLQYDSFVQHV